MSYYYFQELFNVIYIKRRGNRFNLKALIFFLIVFHYRFLFKQWFLKLQSFLFVLLHILTQNQLMKAILILIVIILNKYLLLLYFNLIFISQEFQVFIYGYSNQIKYQSILKCNRKTHFHYSSLQYYSYFDQHFINIFIGSQFYKEYIKAPYIKKHSILLVIFYRMFKKTQSMYQKYDGDSSSSSYQSGYRPQDVTFMKLNKIQSEDQRFVLNQTFQLSSEDQNQLKTFADQLNSLAHSNCSQIKNLHLSQAKSAQKYQQITKKRRKTFSLMKDIQSGPTADQKLKGLLNYNDKISYQKFKILNNPKIERNVISQNGQEHQSYIDPQVITILDYKNENIISKIKVRQYKQFIQKVSKQPKVEIKIPNSALVKIQVELQKLKLKGFFGLQNGKNMKILLENLTKGQKEIGNNTQQQFVYYLVFDINQPTKIRALQQIKFEKKDPPYEKQKQIIHSLNLNRQLGPQSLQRHVFRPFMLFKNDNNVEKPLQRQKYSYDYQQLYLPQIKKYSPYRQMLLSALKKQPQQKKIEPYIPEIQKISNNILAHEELKQKKVKSFRKNAYQNQMQDLLKSSIPSNREKKLQKYDYENDENKRMEKNSKQNGIESQNKLKMIQLSQIDSYISYSDSFQTKSQMEGYLNSKQTIRKPNQKVQYIPNLNIKKVKASRKPSSQNQNQQEKQFRQRSNMPDDIPNSKPQHKQYRIKSKQIKNRRQRKSSHQRENPRFTLHTQQSEDSARRSYNSSSASKYSQKMNKPKKQQFRVQHINANIYNQDKLKQLLFKSTQKNIKRAIASPDYTLKINNITLDMDKFQPSGKFIKMFIQSKYKKRTIFGTQIIEMTSKAIIWSLNNCRFQQIGDYDMFHLQVYQILTSQSDEASQKQINFCGELIISCSQLIHITKSDEDHKRQKINKLSLYNGYLVKSKKLIGNCMISFSLNAQDFLASQKGQSSTQTIHQAPDQESDQIIQQQNYRSNKVGGYSRAKLHQANKQVKFRKRILSQENISSPEKSRSKRSQQMLIYQKQTQNNQISPRYNHKVKNSTAYMRSSDSPIIKAMIAKEQYMNSINQQDDLQQQT